MKCLHNIPVGTSPGRYHSLSPRVQFVSCGCRIVGILALGGVVILELVETYIGGRRYYIYDPKESNNVDTPIEIHCAF